jgi:DNA-directed RNA polymerase specialized sigma54-like protein
MYPSQHLRLKPQIRPLTTAHLAQTMTLLELSAGELEQKIDAELSRNPALEVRDLRRCSVCGQPLINSNQCPRCHPSNDRGNRLYLSHQSERFLLRVMQTRMISSTKIFFKVQRTCQPMSYAR